MTLDVNRSNRKHGIGIARESGLAKLGHKIQEGKRKGAPRRQTKRSHPSDAKVRQGEENRPQKKQSWGSPSIRV